ncbi:gamma carbonic anhydrase family protein [Stutzerimonas balearica]|uniref:gamma carbonic anhydrase family protein n=1 Tax=Stutzerimonas balearica TaxID=74829 RepID=UPI0028AD80AD|nr:gamma carbonic anhydrase family protein [Stutzerimonas balearica]
MSIRSFQQHTPKLGARVFVDPTAVVLGDVEIGEDSSVWPLTVIRCTLGSRILVGMGSIVMDGAVVEDEVIIAAGSLVPPGKRLESGYLYVGSPVKQARPLTDKERSFFAYTAGNYVRLKDGHLAEQG